MRIVADEYMAAVAEAFGPLGDVRTMPGRAITRDALRDADVLLVRSVTRVGAALLDGTPVRFVGSATAGIDHVDQRWLTARGVAFVHAPGSNATAVAEYVVSALLELAAPDAAAHSSYGARGAVSHGHVSHGTVIDPAGPAGFTLHGRTLGVVGVGHVGSRVARLAEALGMSVMRCDPPLADSTGDPAYRPLDELLERADIITLHVPLTRDGPHATADMVNEAWLARLRPGAVLINTSRGEVIDEAALKRFAAGSASSPRRLGGLVLDVWRGEPAVDPELVALADLATPHIAGYSDPAKLAGTRDVYQALCGWLGRPAVWRPPDASPRSLVAPDAALPLEQRMRYVVEQACPVRATSERFKSAMAADGGAAFDPLRRVYHRSHEFADCATAAPQDVELLRAVASLGFGASRRERP